MTLYGVLHTSTWNRQDDSGSHQPQYRETWLRFNQGRGRPCSNFETTATHCIACKFT